MARLRLPYTLSWAEVEPARTTYARLTSDEVASAVRPAVPARRLTGARQPVEDEIDAALQARFGPWASGWRWARDEGSIGGGPVDGWCCSAHSVWQDEDASAEETVGRATAGLLSWRDWVVELDRLFAPAGGEPAPAAIALEQSALAVLAAVVERTSAGDAWYAHAAQVLGWLLESRGEGDRAAEIVRRAVEGRFASWVTPPDDVRNDVARSIRDGVMAPKGAPPDGLELWWASRAETDWANGAGALAPSGPAGRVDATLEHVVRHDAAIDEGRGARMLAALELARASARRGDELTWERLAAWQSVVLGAPASLRARDAWAKGGRERYGRPADLEARVRQALAEASAGEPSAAARGARLYLDLCFLHPFDDGNARAARLGLDFVLTRAGLAIDDAEGLAFRLPLPAGDPAVGRHYLALLSGLLVLAPRDG